MSNQPAAGAKAVLCVGGAHWDRLARTFAAPVLGASNPGRVSVGLGGVARNVAENLARLGCAVGLLSRVGDDHAGTGLLEHAAALSIDTSLTSRSSSSGTGSFDAVIGNDGEMVVAVADMQIYEEITPALLAPQLPDLGRFQNWFLDCNLREDTLWMLLESAGASTVAAGAVSPEKAKRLMPMLGRIGILFANLVEGRVLAGLDPMAPIETPDVVERLRARGCRSGVLTAGGGDVNVWSDGSAVRLSVPVAEQHEAVGAGDSLVAGTLFGLRRRLSLPDAARWGIAAASVTLESRQAVSSRMSESLLSSRLGEGKSS